MKRLFTIVLVSLLAINTSFAQVEQGTFILGATTELSDNAWSMVSMKPSIGYFVSDAMAVGLGFSLGTSTKDTEMDVWGSTTNEKYTETESSSNMTIGPWMRFYMGEMFFINAGVEIGSGSETDKTTDKDQSGWIDSDGNLVSEKKDTDASFTLDIGAGASVLWGDHIAFEPMLLFNMGSSSVTPFDQDTQKGPTTINVGFKIGVCVLLGDF